MKTKLFSLFLAFTASIGLIYAEKIDGINYVLDTENLTAVVGYNVSVSGEIVIPSSITYNAKTYSVIMIGDNAFNSCIGLTSIIIGNGVVSIGERAFAYCKSLSIVTLPGSVKSIGERAFASCRGLTSIIIPNSVTSIGEKCFENCESLIAIEIPNSVTRIENSTFDGCSALSSIIIPSSIEYIGEGAFNYCSSLTSITIPNSVKNIGDNAFWNCTSLTSPVYNEHVFAYMPTTYNGAYSIPNGITTIAGGAFCGCSDLTSIILPESLVSIGAWAFSQCSGLTSISIPNNLRSIGEYAFDRCGTLASITIPNSVTDIGNYAFFGCFYLVNVKLPDNLTSIADGLFRDCTSLSSIIIPNTVTSIGNEAFVNTILTSVTIPNSVTDISEKAFWNCNFLDTIILGNGISHIGKEAFKETAWYNNAKNWEDRVLYIGDYLIEADLAYYSQSIYTIKQGTLCIAESAFYNEYGMHSVTIPNSVRNIGNNAFSRCHGLYMINNYAITPQIINENVFNDVDISECILNVPEESVDLYVQADVWKEFGHVIPCYADKIEDAEPVIIPSETTVKIVWLAVNDADKYELVIRKKNGSVLYRFTFDAQGLLIDIAFRAPSHNNAPLQTQEVGFAYLVTGLDSGTTYDYSIIAKNNYNVAIDTETGSFSTKTPESIDSPLSDAEKATKLLHNGQLLILRGDKTYTLTGQEVK